MARCSSFVAVLVVLLMASELARAEPFVRGDANESGAFDISDMSYILNFLFRGGPAPLCGDAADVNDDGEVNISDPSYGLNFLFRGGPAVPPPGPVPGFDGTPVDPFTCGDPEESPVEEAVDFEQEVGGFDFPADGKVGIGTVPGVRSGVVVDLDTGRVLSGFETGPNPGAVRFGPAGSTALITNLGSLAEPGNEITWVDVESPQRPRAAQVKIGARVTELCWANERIALALAGGTDEKPASLVSVIDGARGESLGNVNVGFRPRGAHADRDLAVVVGDAPDGQRGEALGGIALFDLAQGEMVGNTRLPEARLPVAVRMFGGNFFVSDGTQDGLAVAKLNEDMKFVGGVGRGRRGELLLRPDGRFGYSLTLPGNELLVFETDTMREVTTIHLDFPDSDPVDVPDVQTNRMAFAENGDLLLVASSHHDHLFGVDTRSNRLLGHVRSDPRGLGLGFTDLKVSGDGRSLYLSGGSALVGVVSIAALRWEIFELPDWVLIPIRPVEFAIDGDTCLEDIAILMDDGNANANTSFVDGANREIVSNVIPRFYSIFPDVYDSVVVFYGSEFGNITSPGAFAWSWTVRNFTRNINRGLGTSLNSSGTMITAAGVNRLQCVIWENDLNEYDALKRCVNQGNTVFGNLRDGLAILGQEVLHRWSSRLDVTGKGCTILRDNAHYHAFFNSDASVVGGSQGFRYTDNGNGTFTRTAVEAVFAEYDLYLMGFRDPANVAQTMYCIQNPAVAAGANTFSGTRRNISMNDITNANGTRVPSAAISQHTFNIAYVLVVPNGDHVLTADLDEIKSFRDDFSEFFNDETDGAGHINTRVCPTPFSRVVDTIDFGGMGANDVAVAPNGRWAYVVHFNSSAVSVVDTDASSPTFHQTIDTINVGPAPTEIAFRPDSAFAFVTIRDANRVDIINTATRAVVGNISVGDEPIGIHINRAPFGFVTNRADDDVTIIRPLAFDAIGDFAVGGRPQGVAGTIDNEVVVVTNRNSNTVTVRGTRSGVVRTVATGTNPIAVDVVQYESLPNQTVARINGSRSPVALAYVVNATPGTVTVIDMTTDPDDPASFTASPIDTINVGSGPVDVAFQPNGAIALVANRASNNVSVIEVASHDVITTVTVDTAPDAIAFSPDGLFAYVANDLGRSLTILE